jgi:chemotaxis protein methyltransferase WspC
MRRHGPSAEAFHLLGLLNEASGGQSEAITSYRKALYLDPLHQEALIHFALLMEKLDRKAEAQVLRTRARRLAQKA